MQKEERYYKDTLPNGLRVITAPMPSARSVAVMVMVGAGSRYEGRRINGISHFMEHMFFKGAERYPTAMDVSTMVDSVGGIFNAFTGEEKVAYFLKLSSSRKNVAYDVLSDMLLNSKFAVEEIERERGVIIEEIRMYNDDPMSQVQIDFKDHFFGDQPLGWDIAGPEDNIRTVTREDFIHFRDAHYSSTNAVLSVAGDVTREENLKFAGEFFGSLQPKEKITATPYAAQNGQRSFFRKREIEQAHFAIGFPIPGDNHEIQPTLKIMNNILGGTMSSRLFHSIRERRGLAYYIRSSRNAYTDTGVLKISSGVNLDKIETAIECVMEEVVKMATEGVTEQELNRARENIKGHTDLGLEDSMSVASIYASREILYGKVKTPEEMAAELDAVTLDMVNAAAKEYIRPEKVKMAVLGPYDDMERFDRKLG